MGKIKMVSIFCLIVLGSFLWILPLKAQTVSVNCDTGGSLQTAIRATSTPGTTFYVTGTCNENITISEPRERFTLDGGGTATINGLDLTTATIQILAPGVTIRGFTILGGNNGIMVYRGGAATIESNTIQNTGGIGIQVNQNGFARIVNNMIRNNLSNGIVVMENSYARIGFLTGSDTIASPNTIENNGDNGIYVGRSSSARIVGNIIRNNTNDGIQVDRVSQADICDNTIDGNGQNGIFVAHNSGVDLGKNTGTTIFDLPNTTTVNNGDKGVRCSIGGYVDGRLGTLKGLGKHDATDFSKDCIDSLIP